MKRAHAAMEKVEEPAQRPGNPNFGSGPCAKRPGWDFSALAEAPLGRSHRSALGKAKLQAALENTHSLLGLPENYLVGIVPASDTGAVEMVMWSMLGERPVDICYWESFGKTWYEDAVKELKLEGVTQICAEFGVLPDLSKADPAHDIVFTYNGTTSGVRVPNLDWISSERTGLTICDATSAIFGMDMLPWEKLDVITYSWQKVLGGEGGHGMLILSPRAVSRLESYKPPRALPKIFRLTKGGKINGAIFKGEVINTPSMMCVEDYLDALSWARQLGGMPALLAKSAANFKVLADYVEKTPWLEFLCTVPEHRSNTSVCFVMKQPNGDGMAKESVDKFRKLLEQKGVCYDIGAYRDAPPGLRIWCGATVEAGDLQVLTGWFDWAYAQVAEA
jgi:phosphoserine aminotransferase